MNPLIVPTRNAIVSTINGAGLTPAITAIGIYDMTLMLDRLSTDRVVVVPSTKETDLLNRQGESRGDVSCEVAIQHKVQSPTTAASEIDPYMNLAERYADLFLGKTFTLTLADSSTVNARCLRVEYPHPMFDEHMREFRVFTSVLRPIFSIF